MLKQPLNPFMFVTVILFSESYFKIHSIHLHSTGGWFIHDGLEHFEHLQLVQQRTHLHLERYPMQHLHHTVIDDLGVGTIIFQ